MYLESIRLRNLKCFDDLTLRFQTAGQTGDPQSNWNVILGDNGTGKTSLLRAIAACLMDATTAEQALRPDGWVRDSGQRARLTARIVQEPGDVAQDGDSARTARTVQYAIVNSGEEITLSDGQKEFFSSTRVMEPNPSYRTLFEGDFTALFGDINFLKKNAFSGKTGTGWFSCGYGAYRRNEDLPWDGEPIRGVQPFVTLFNGSAGLFFSEKWLRLLAKASVDQKIDYPSYSILLEQIKQSVHAVLPDVDAVRIEAEKEPRFSWQGRWLNLSSLSDGYQSMFALVLDMFARMFVGINPATGKLTELNQGRGIVLIDEIDAHLHPRWQRDVGFLLTKTFPNVQFIVTSHSPFVAMAAGKGALTVLERDGDAVRHSQEVPYVRGWAVDQVLTQVFGLLSLRDPETAAKLERYETLAIGRRAGHLTPEEAAELARLEAYLNERMRGDAASPRERQMDEDLALFAAEARKRKGEHA